MTTPNTNTPRLVGRDPEAELRTRRALDMLSALINSLLLSGDIVATGQNQWAIARRTPPIFLEQEQEEQMLIPGPPGIGLPGKPGQVLYLEPEPGEDGLMIPGQSGVAGTPGNAGVAGAPGSIILLEADPGEDAMPVPGPAGVAGATGGMGPVGPMGAILWLEADPPEDAMHIPGNQGATGPTGSTGSQGVPGAYIYLEPDQTEDAVWVPIQSPNILPAVMRRLRRRATR